MIPRGALDEPRTLRGGEVSLALRAGGAALAALFHVGSAAHGAEWLAGDLHVHTTYSHDSWSGPGDDNTGVDEAYTFGWSVAEQILLAEARGLDFLVITDHNDTRSVSDPGYASERLVLVAGYENSLAGHAQMIGAATCYEPAVTTEVVDCNQFANKDDPAVVRELAENLRAAGGAFQINHPSDGDWLGAFGDGSSPNPIVPDSIEVWNIGPWHYQPPFEAANDNDFSIAFWETFLNAGHPVAATGGSDNHWRSTAAVQGVGQPTTWVYAESRTSAAVAAAIRAGRTFVSREPPAHLGPRVFLEADADGDGSFESMVGDTVPAGAALRIRGENLLLGAFYRVVTNEGTTDFDAATEVLTAVPPGRWVRVEVLRPDARDERRSLCEPIAGGSTTYCRNRLVVEALTSAIFVAP